MSVQNIVKRVLNTASQMLRDRYDEDSVMDFDAHTVMGETVVVILMNVADTAFRIGIQDVRNAQDQFPDKRLILVSNGGSTPFLSGRMTTEPMRGVEVFTTTQLMLNISRHALVPRHTRLETAHVKKILRQLGASSSDALPTLLTTDPVARYYGFEIGDVIRIDRRDRGDAGLPLCSTALRVVRTERT